LPARAALAAEAGAERSIGDLRTLEAPAHAPAAAAGGPAGVPLAAARCATT
jgi:hypothetical protein